MSKYFDGYTHPTAMATFNSLFWNIQIIFWIPNIIW